MSIQDRLFKQVDDEVRRTGKSPECIVVSPDEARQFAMLYCGIDSLPINGVNNWVFYTNWGPVRVDIVDIYAVMEEAFGMRATPNTDSMVCK